MCYNLLGDSMSNDLIRRLLIYIDNNIYSKISIEDLARIFYFNKDYIMRLFKKEIGCTIIDYICRKRIYLSLEELRTTDDYILKIALKHGFTSQEYYCEQFTKVLGVNPNTYRKFTKNNPSVSYEEIELIRRNLTELQYKLQIIEKYKNSTYKETIKKLSMFQNWHLL